MKLLNNAATASLAAPKDQPEHDWQWYDRNLRATGYTDLANRMLTAFKPQSHIVAAPKEEAPMPPSVTTSIDSIAHDIARPVRGCATDEQYTDVIQRATDALTAAAQTLVRATPSSQQIKATELVNTLVNAAFDCGAWDAEDASESYQEVYERKTRAFQAVLDALEGRSQQVKEAAREIAERWIVTQNLPVEAQFHSLSVNQLQVLAEQVIQRICFSAESEEKAPHCD